MPLPLVGLEPTLILLPRPPESWDYNYVSLRAWLLFPLSRWSLNGGPDPCLLCIEVWTSLKDAEEEGSSTPCSEVKGSSWITSEANQTKPGGGTECAHSREGGGG